MSVNAKASATPRRVWRMTADNPLGEILELVPKAASSGDRNSSREVTWTKVPAGSPAAPLEPKLGSKAAPEPARRVVTTRTSLDAAASWRASSYDLLNGLRVCDLSEKMPTRIFNSLFSADVAASGVSVRKSR